MTRKRIQYFCTLSWILSLIFISLLFAIPNDSTKTSYREDGCLISNYIPEQYLLIFYGPFFALMTLIILIIYGRIHYSLRRRSMNTAAKASTNNASAQASARVVRLAVYVIGNFARDIFELGAFRKLVCMYFFIFLIQGRQVFQYQRNIPDLQIDNFKISYIIVPHFYYFGRGN